MRDKTRGISCLLCGVIEEHRRHYGDHDYFGVCTILEGVVDLNVPDTAFAAAKLLDLVQLLGFARLRRVVEMMQQRRVGTPARVGTAVGRPPTDDPLRDLALPERLDEFEREIILMAYRRTRGNETKTAQLLGIKVTALHYKLEKYGIGPADAAASPVPHPAPERGISEVARMEGALPGPAADPELVAKLAMRVDELDLSVRSANALRNYSISYVGNLVQKTEVEMLKSKLFGHKTLKEIKAALATMGFTLGMQLDEATIAAVRAEIARRAGGR